MFRLKFKYSLVVVLFMCMMLCLTACGENRTLEKQSEIENFAIPQNVYVELNLTDEKIEYLLTWDKVKNAKCYSLHINNIVSETKNTYYNITDCMPDGYATICLVANGKNDNADSEKFRLNYKAEQVTDGLIYEKTDGGVIVAKGNSELGEKVIIPDKYNSEKVLEVADMGFSHEKNLKEIKLPKYLTKIRDNAFLLCENLSLVNFPSTLQVVGYKAFEGCNFKTLSLPNITWGDCCFWNNYNLEYVDCSDLSVINEDLFGCTYNLKEVKLSNKLIKIETGAFYCSGIKNIVIPYSVKVIGDYAFASSGKNNLPNDFTIEFEKGCELEEIGEKCFEYRLLHDITIPKTIKKIGLMAFYRCPLERFEIEEGGETYKIIDNNLYSPDGKELLSYTYGKDVEEFTVPETVESFADYAFAGSMYVKKINAENIKSIGYRTFYKAENIDCIDLSGIENIREESAFELAEIKNIILSAKLKVIPALTFEYAALDKLIIPEGVEVLSESIFLCTKTQYIILPKSIRVCSNGFIWVFALQTSRLCDYIFYCGNEEEWNSITFTGKRELDLSGKNKMLPTLYFYSEDQPANKGSYWHYDFDGVTPVIWE